MSELLRDSIKSKKHAFCVGVYKNPDYVKAFLETILSNRSSIYVHINKENIQNFNSLCNTSFFEDNHIDVDSSVSVRWGGATLLESMMVMLRKALSNKQNEWFHVLTGQDVMIRPLGEFFDLFDQNPQTSYIGYREKPISAEDKEDEGWVERYYRYHFYDYFKNVRNNRYLMGVDYVLTKIQKILHLKRKNSLRNIYKCSSWFSLHRDAAEEILNYYDNHVSELKHTFAPEEMIFASVLLNNKRYNVVNNSLRYIKWTKPEQNEVGSPDLLFEENFEEIVKSGKFFARKIDPIKSEKLLLKIKNYIEEK